MWNESGKFGITLLWKLDLLEYKSATPFLQYASSWGDYFQWIWNPFCQWQITCHLIGTYWSYYRFHSAVSIFHFTNWRFHSTEYRFSSAECSFCSTKYIFLRFVDYRLFYNSAIYRFHSMENGSFPFPWILTPHKTLYPIHPFHSNKPFILVSHLLPVSLTI